MADSNLSIEWFVYIKMIILVIQIDCDVINGRLTNKSTIFNGGFIYIYKLKKATSNSSEWMVAFFMPKNYLIILINIYLKHSVNLKESP